MWVLLIIMLVVAAVIGLFSFDLSWNNVVVKERNDLVFEDKNKSYGAFVIRRDYNTMLLIALAVSVGFAVAVTVGPLVYTLIKGSESDVKIDKDMIV
ncbi:MAG TPA: hypothetical protein VNZ86_15205, partial [Bacteroidia bacterium]|nr:hypothetical protein [Bacteroidia bacterium]